MSNLQPFVIEKIKNSQQYISCTLISIYTLLALDDKVDDMPKIEKLYLMCNKNIFFGVISSLEFLGVIKYEYYYYAFG